MSPGELSEDGKVLRGGGGDGKPWIETGILGCLPCSARPFCLLTCVRTFAMTGDHEAAPAVSGYTAFDGKLPFKTQWLQYTHVTTWRHHTTGEIFLRKKG